MAATNGRGTMDSTPAAGVKRASYDWRACALSLVAAMAAAVPAGLLVTRLVGSTLFLTVVVTLVGTVVARWTYGRVARPGARPMDAD
jgi:hypothetical protein